MPLYAIFTKEGITRISIHAIEVETMSNIPAGASDREMIEKNGQHCIDGATSGKGDEKI